MIVNDLDFGGGHPFPAPQTGQVVGSAVVEGLRTSLWPRGRVAEKHDVTFWASAWQGVAGQAAGSYLALRLMLHQLEEMAGNPDLQPIYVQWAATAQTGQYNVSTPHDGWYLIENVQPDYRRFVVAGLVPVNLTVARHSPPSPAALAVSYIGAALSSGFSAAAVPLVAAPKGATLPLTSATRAGAEGSIPICYPGTTGPNPVPFAASATLSDLWKCGCRVYDTVTAGGNAPPTDGTAANTAWLEVKGADHAFGGDVVVTNGLLLLQFVLGAAGAPTVWMWNTNLSPAQWQNVGAVQYKDSAFNAATLQQVSLERVGLQLVRLTAKAATSAGHWAELVWSLQAGRRDAGVEFWPRTQSNATAYGLDFITQQTIKTIWNESGVVDVALNPSTNLAPTAGVGFGAAMGTNANQGILGWLYQAVPGTAQPAAGSTTDFGFGDGALPLIGTYRYYGIFAVPYALSVDRQAEAESGTLGTGWSSVSDGGIQVAKCVSGTASTNADLWGTSAVPTAGGYDVWVLARVTSAASATPQMQIGLWDATSSAFMAGGSTTYAPNQWTTGYTWKRVNTTIPVTPTAAHNMRFRAVTTATLGTDWWIDKAVLVPLQQGSATGVGEFPEDIYLQFAYDAEKYLVVG